MTYIRLRRLQFAMGENVGKAPSLRLLGRDYWQMHYWGALGGGVGGNEDGLFRNNDNNYSHVKEAVCCLQGCYRALI